MKYSIAAILLLPCLAISADVDKEKALGGLGAPVRIEVYSSFACTHCKEFHETVLPQIVKDYVLSGKVCVVSRELFPLNYAVAKEAATFATAAARIGKYQPVADVLFRTQQQWVTSGNVWQPVASVLTPAQQKQVQALAKDPSVAGEIQQDIESAKAIGATQTPTLFVIAGTRRYPIAGSPDYSLFRGFLDSLLK